MEEVERRENLTADVLGVRYPSLFLECSAGYGYVDHSGRVVIISKFDLTFHFSKGLAAVEIGGVRGNINRIGKIVFEPTALLTW